MAKDILEICFILAIDDNDVTKLIEIEQQVFIHVPHIPPLRYEFKKEYQFECLSCEKYICCENERRIELSCPRELKFKDNQYDKCFMLAETSSSVAISEHENVLLSSCDIIKDERKCGVFNGTACYEKGKRILSIQLIDIVKIEPKKINTKYI